MTEKTEQLAEFENSIKSLEKLVAKLETGELSLEKSLKYFEEGIKLSRYCQTALKQAEQKVTLLIKDNQDLVEKPFRDE